MVDLDMLRTRIVTRLNGLRNRRGKALGALFGEGRPYGRYDSDMIAYFTGQSDAHPILPLSYLCGQQNERLAGEVLGIVLEELATEQHGMSELACTRIDHWRAAEATSKLALSVTDEVAYAIMRAALAFMLAHYDHIDPGRRSNYSTGALVGQLVAWYLGDILMQEPPDDSFRPDASMSEETRKEYDYFVTGIIRTECAARGLQLHERMTASEA